MCKVIIDRAEKELSDLLGEPCSIRVLTRGGYTQANGNNVYYIKGRPEGVSFGVYVGHKFISKFTLLQMPGCCGICISTGACVDSKWRGKGINTILNRFRIDIARDLEYTVLMCTDVASNIAQKKILKKNGWTDIFQFTNARTNNLVDISVIHL